MSFVADVPEPSVCGQSGAHLHHHVPDGNVGFLMCWRLPPEPQTMPHLQRQGLPPS